MNEAITLHRYGKFDRDHGRGGRYGDLSGQDYWTEYNGTRWEIETARTRSRNPAMWTAWNGSGTFLVAFSRKELEAKIKGA